MLGHLSFLDEPQSSSDEINQDGYTDDAEQEERNDNTSDGSARNTTTRFTSSVGLWFLDGRSEWLQEVGAPGRSPSPRVGRRVPGIEVEDIGSGSVGG